MKKLWIFLTLLILLAVLPAQAQESLRLAAVEVKLWPEFDRRAVLVITHLTLPAGAALPQTLHLRIPAQADLNAVAEKSPESELVNAYYEEIPGAEWTTLAIRATSPEIWVEYYTALQIDGNQRRIEYRWPGDLAVEAFRVRFQTPLGAENVSTDPMPETMDFDSYNLRNFITPTVSLEAGETYLFTAFYDKADDRLSATTAPIESALPLEESGGQLSWADVLPWVAGVLGVVLLALGILMLFGFLKTDRPARKTSSPRHKKHPAPPAEEEETAVYCHTCGNRARPGDQFCRTCGTRLRRGDE